MGSPLPTLEPQPNRLRRRLWRIIFLSDTTAGRLFDVILLLLIGLSVLTVALESVDEYHALYGDLFFVLEWVFTVLFTIEYAARLWVVRNQWLYAASFFGVVDLLSIAPTWLELLVPDVHYFMTLRILRLLRMFRILKMAQHVSEAGVLLSALRGSRHKIMVFLTSVIALVSVEGTMMYVLERSSNPGFNSIPQAVYWAIVTITTVGYGDISPVTVLGKVMASIIMLTGFAIIAVPTGIVTSELGRRMTGIQLDERACRECGLIGHDPRARYCHHCAQPLQWSPATAPDAPNRPSEPA